MYRAVAALSFASLVLGQQAGDVTEEKHPDLPIQVCTESGCTTEQTTVVLDVSITQAPGFGCPSLLTPTTVKLALDPCCRWVHQLLRRQRVERDNLP